MSAWRKRLEDGGRLGLAYLLDPPGWIPAWAMTAVILVAGYLGITAALYNPEISIERIAAAEKVLSLLTDTYKATLGMWLGYKGAGALFATLARIFGKEPTS